MRIAATLLLALLLAVPAIGQTQPNRLFTATDYTSYFSEGDFHIETLPYGTVATEHARRIGKVMTLSTIEVGPNDNPGVPYPFMKRKGDWKRSEGTFDTKKQALTYRLTNADLDVQLAAELWLSMDKRTSISPGDVRAGNVQDNNIAMGRTAGLTPEQSIADYRRFRLGLWTLRCSFVDAPSYDVECIQTNPAKDYQITRRYRKQVGMS